MKPLLLGKGYINTLVRI